MATTDFRTTQHQTETARRDRRRSPASHAFAVTAASCLGLVAALAASIAPPGTVAPVIAAVAGFAVSSFLAGLAFKRAYPHQSLGLCNVVTLLRLALAMTLMVPLLGPAAGNGQAWAVFGIAAVGFALDGVDGRLARRAGISSAFGARFDMEVDALFAALLALLALQSGKAGVWVLALGFMRYGFAAAGMVWPWLRGPLPERWRRKAVCVAQIGVLIALLAPVITPPTSQALAALATALLVWSFVADIVWLRRARR